MKEKLVELIIDVAREMSGSLDEPIPVEQGEETPLYGQSGVLDSMGLVRMVLTVEETIEDTYGVALVLADEKAMSQRTSPFLTIGTLARYADQLMREEQANAA